MSTMISELPSDHRARLHFGAQRYVATQFILMPYDDQFILGSAYGNLRSPILIGTAEEVLAYLQADFAKHLANAQHQARHAERIAADAAKETSALSDLDIQL